MERKLVHLGREELDRIITIAADGTVVCDTDALAIAISRALGVLGVRVAISSLDYLQHDDRTPESDTRTASGMWWKSHGDDTADIGGFVLEGLALSLTHEGTSGSPLVEDLAVIERATQAIAQQHPGAVVVEPGLLGLSEPVKGGQARVFVTRDHRLRRPEDLLEPQEADSLNRGQMALVIVQMIGGDKALVIGHGL